MFFAPPGKYKVYAYFIATVLFNDDNDYHLFMFLSFSLKCNHEIHKDFVKDFGKEGKLAEHTRRYKQ